MNINEISLWVRDNGRIGRSPWDGGSTYPRMKARVLYLEGLLWGGMVGDDPDLSIRVGGSRYRSGLRPGRILQKGVAENPNDPGVGVWRIRRDWETVDLTRDAAEFFRISMDSVNTEHVRALRERYEIDWKQWPWEKGAPFYDDNHNGIMDADEEPGLAYADQVVWLVANDIDANAVDGFVHSSQPLGLEMQMTLWAYDRRYSGADPFFHRLNEALKHIVFKRARLIYKGISDEPETITNMYIGQWVDPDLGDAVDDLVGCDVKLDLGFVYNANAMDDHFTKYGLIPPSLGYAFLQGPLVYSAGNEAQFDFREKSDFKNLSMTSFTYEAPGDPFSEPTTLRGYYYMLQGYDYNVHYERKMRYPHPPGVEPTFFPLSGDPVTGTGHIDGLFTYYSFSPSDKRFTCSSGPFSMAIGDTQEVIVAMVGGSGSDRLASVSVMKYYTKWARQVAKDNFEVGFAQPEPSTPDIPFQPQDFRLYQNYPNPFNSETEIRYDLPVQRRVKLTIYNLLGQMVKVLVDKNQEAKSYKIRWDGTDSRGEKVPTGLYLNRIEAGSMILMKKMLLVE